PKPTPVPTASKVTQVRPGAPTAVRTSLKSRRITIRWVAPASNGSPAITKYRAKVYEKRSGKSLKYRATCTATGRTFTCRTPKLTSKRTYVVVVQARTIKGSKGYGPRSVPVSRRIK
ncbi:MAG: fibronectin type III domain-containing protein, partial [Candidatus Nanopelagicales bacterium]